MPEISNDHSVSHIFLFVNPTSGGNAASVLTAPGFTELPISLPDNTNVILHIHDIRNGEKRNKPGFVVLREVSEQANQTRVIAAGGDGTVMWCLSEMESHQVNMNKIALGVMPFGTGNDFARALEWTLPSPLKPFEQDNQQLKSLASQWFSAPSILHDLWEVEVEVKAAGEFMKVSGEEKEKKAMIDSNGQNITSMTLPMSNYFSLGVESRIGIGFDKNRTTSALRNKMVYTKEGLKKTLFTSTLTIQQAVHSLSDFSDGNKRTLFTTAPSPHPLLGASVSLIAVNIPSFASGLDVWGNSDKCGLEARKLDGELAMLQQLGDAELEFCSFASVAGIGAEVAAAGHGRRVGRGKGPFVLSFNDIGSEKCYFQVDGEFFVMKRPKQVKLHRTKSITVLANPSSKKSKHYIPA